MGLGTQTNIDCNRHIRTCLRSHWGKTIRVSEGTVLSVSKTSEAAGGSDRMFDRRLYFSTAVLAALVVLVGFARTFYLRIWFDVPPLSALRYLHGLLMTIWYALFLAQVMLVFRRRIDIHRRLGIVAALTAAALVPVGSATAIAFMRRLRTDPDAASVAAIIAGYDFV